MADNVVYLFGVALQLFFLMYIASELHSIKKEIAETTQTDSLNNTEK